jgi:hypothetical protein
LRIESKNITDVISLKHSRSGAGGRGAGKNNHRQSSHCQQPIINSKVSTDSYSRQWRRRIRKSSLSVDSTRQSTIKEMEGPSATHLPPEEYTFSSTETSPCESEAHFDTGRIKHWALSLSREALCEALMIRDDAFVSLLLKLHSSPLSTREENQKGKESPRLIRLLILHTIFFAQARIFVFSLMYSFL